MKNNVQYSLKVSSNKNESVMLHSSNDVEEIAALCNHLNKESKKYIVAKDTRYNLVLKREDGEYTLCTSKNLIDVGFAAYAVHKWDNEKKPEKYHSTVAEFPSEWLTVKHFKPFWTQIKKMVA
jgi:hypothetical protein